MKTSTHPSSFHQTSPPITGRTTGYAAQTGYPVGAVLQGKFLLSLGERALDEVAPQFTHGDHAVESTVAYFDRLLQGADGQVLRTVQDEEDKGVRRMERRQVDPQSGQQVFAAGNLAGLKLDESLELVGHGTMQVDADGTPIKVVHFGGMTPEELAAYLVANGLPKGYKGVISLTGCSTGYGGAESYAVAFQRNLHQRKELGKGRPVVLGYTGTAHVGKHTHDSISSGMMVQRNLPALRAAKDSLWALSAEIQALVPSSSEEKLDAPASATSSQAPPLQRLSKAVSIVASATFQTFYLEGFDDSRATLRASEESITYYDDSLTDVEQEQLQATVDFCALVRGFIAHHPGMNAIASSATAIASSSATTNELAASASSSSPSASAEADLKAIEAGARAIMAREMPDPLSQNHETAKHEIPQKLSQKGCCIVQ